MSTGSASAIAAYGGRRSRPWDGIAHGSMPFLGDSAIRHMSAVLETFEHELYPALAARHSDMPVVPDGARQSTMNINSVHGGQAEDFEGLPAPCVADSCRIVIDRRFLIEEALGSVRGEVTSLLDRLAGERPGFRYKMRELFSVEPVMADRNGPVASATANAIRTVLGREAKIVCSPGTYDQKHVDRIGAPQGLHRLWARRARSGAPAR